jgi:hypothetical protein
MEVDTHFSEVLKGLKAMLGLARGPPKETSLCAVRVAHKAHCPPLRVANCIIDILGVNTREEEKGTWVW